jgi:hypothetical protein
VKVLIVAKTRMRDAFCVGGLTLEDNRNVRLMTPEGQHQPESARLAVGQIWEMDLRPGETIEPPHVEDVVATPRKLLERVWDLSDFLLKRVRPWRGPPSCLFGGLLRFSPSGSGYIGWDCLPPGSVGFWTADADLVLRRDEEERARYFYPTVSGAPPRRIKHVGAGPPEPEIPAGSLIRVSLSRWWAPEESNANLEARCYLQISGRY